MKALRRNVSQRRALEARPVVIGALAAIGLTAAVLGILAIAPSLITFISRGTPPEAAEYPPPLASLPPLPPNWPAELELGMSDGPGTASEMRATAPFGFRYQYLAGGVNTGNGWAHWNPNGSFVSDYIKESLDNGLTPVLTYYMLTQSAPGAGQAEKQAVLTNLKNPETMTAYWQDVRLFFQRAGATDAPVVLHVEPDLWAYAEMATKKHDATTVRAIVGSAGLSELQDLPDNVAGFAQAFLALRDAYAKNVLVAFHYSIWGAGQDPVYSNPTPRQIENLSQKSITFYRSLNADFDLIFHEFSDRDAAYKQVVHKSRNAWWYEGDFARNLTFLSNFTSAVDKRIVMWQIPYGNTVMRAQNNTVNHYQDNKVELLLGSADRELLRRYIQAGVILFLFGRGADGVTCACDANKDGITNPEPINENTELSLSADDDGGYFRQQAAEYYRKPERLP